VLSGEVKRQVPRRAALTLMIVDTLPFRSYHRPCLVPGEADNLIAERALKASSLGSISCLGV